MIKNVFILITSLVLILYISNNTYTDTNTKKIFLHRINKFEYYKKNIINVDYKVFKFINSTLKCKILDYFIIISHLVYDRTKFNYDLIILIIIVSIFMLWKYKKRYFYFNICTFFIILLISTIINYICKSLCARERPITCLGITNVHTILEKKLHNSFPSGHTQIAFSICTFMIMIIKKYRLLYIVATIFISLERIYVGSHFPLDVIFGALLGILITYLILIIINFFYKT
jgi:undecaprenyl-diphosphatase